MPNDPIDDQTPPISPAPPLDDVTPISNLSSGAPTITEDEDPEFASMSPRERALVTKARAQEKQKLYKSTNDLKRQVTDLRNELRAVQQAPPLPTSTGQETRDVAIERLGQMIQETQQQLREMQTQEVQRRRDSDLRRYTAERLRDMQASGKDVIAALVGGDSEEEIDQSIAIARAEYLLTEEKITARGGNRGVPASVTVGQHNGRPAGTPPVMTPNTVEADPHDELMTDITSDPDAAVRSGAYQKNRTSLLGKLKRNYRYGQPPA
jgi:hypothetical protein